MRDLDPWYKARAKMVEAVVADLHGSEQDDSLTEEPLERFIVGILYPQASDGGGVVEVADESPDGEAGTAPDADYDPGVSFAHLRYPSTMGLTCGLTTSTTRLVVEVEADRYTPAVVGHEPTVEEAVASRAHSRRHGRWELVRERPEPLPIELSGASTITTEIADGLQLRAVIREPQDGVVSVTLVLINTKRRPEKGKADELCWFRPLMRVTAENGTFADRDPRRRSGRRDADELSGDLLYRAERHLAVGHGVAVTWAEGPTVSRVETTFFPEHDLRLAKADRDDIAGLRMSELAEAPDVQALQEPLATLVRSYGDWVDRQETRLPGLSAEHRVTAQRHLDDARVAVERMSRGIHLLVQDREAERAFRVMNVVMQEQRARQELVRNGPDATTQGVVGEWRPFQMAFILLNLEGLADPRSEDRSLADLLWFPTGGGKTEAYLGLIAFTLVLRRLRGAGADGDGAGVGVIMRYTLRLLTLQQFERAAGLICALEEFRGRDPELGNTAPFSLGLWVGQGATPNDVKAAAQAIRKRRQGEDPGEGGDPVQLLHCPWCGSRLSAEDYEADKHADRVVVRCPGLACRFHQGDGLPVHLVDSDVYRERPSLVIGTVDKFAMLAWRERAGRLFGSGYDAPPDLIVQDELHLISGPLGTLVGLYETAVDHLATDRASGVRPKLVASTATIRRAAGQVSAVFDRPSAQFPPPGIDADDSFFAVDACPAEKGTRRYVGLMAPGTSHATLLVRTYAALLQGAKDLDAPDDVKDAYWTLLGYFNSLRVLGAAYIQSIDDVRDRIGVVAGRKGTEKRETRDPRELTSRKKASEIPEELKALQTAMPDPGSPDVVLATNMISVGVDVDRLGLMAVMGQPQTTSEYIQSTSRVGRRHPGLVFTLFNASRSRDLSHYESFTTYHRALYRQVEATGATPFAPRALDRGLHGLLVILARHALDGAAGDKSVRVPVETDGLRSVADVIVARASSVAGKKTAQDVRRALDALIDQWEAAVEGGDVLQYARWAMQARDVKALMSPAGSTIDGTDGVALLETFPPPDPPWPTLTSLRNVDRESTLKIISTRRTKAVADDGDE
ncbi:helicase-related protein [Cellulosimicrobium cellulans]|uniref:helicase-related protein n=1 Tax=Cellulosimicrobium cellulans TaxID=1710 RepID=UPI003018AEAB